MRILVHPSRLPAPLVAVSNTNLHGSTAMARFQPAMRAARSMLPSTSSHRRSFHSQHVRSTTASLPAIVAASPRRRGASIASTSSSSVWPPRIFTRSFQHDQLYVGQDAARQNEKKFSELSGKIPWEPEVRFLESVKTSWLSPEPNLNELIREDLPLARNLFRNVLQQYYRQDMGMWNKWGCMEWKAGNYDLARMIFTKAAKISFHRELWQSWATMEMEIKNYLEAKRLYNVILATDPHSAMAGLGMALLESEIGQHAKARERFEVLVEHHADDVLVLQAFAVFEARQQNMPLARDLFGMAVVHPNATAQVWHAWAKAEFDWGFYKNTLTVLDRGMHKFPTHKWLVQLGAMAHYKLGNTYEARRGFQRLVAGGLYVEPSSYNAYAKMEEELGYEDIAVGLYMEALRAFPEHVPSAMALAILHHKMGNVDRGRKVFENALERIQAKHYAAHYSADMMFAWGAFEEKYAHEFDHAKELFVEVTKTMPTHVESWRALARVESRLGNVDAARTVLTRAAQYITTDAPLLIELAKIEQKNRNFAAARRAYEKALKLDPSRAAAWNMRALLELQLDPERAKNIIENALTAIPRFEKKSWSILLCTYGRAFAAMGEIDKAVAAFQKSFKLSSKNWETHVIYAESVLQPNGAWAEAKKHLLAAWKLLPKSDKKRKSVEAKIKFVEEQLTLEATTVEEMEKMAEKEDDEDDDVVGH